MKNCDQNCKAIIKNLRLEIDAILALRLKIARWAKSQSNVKGLVLQHADAPWGGDDIISRCGLGFLLRLSVFWLLDYNMTNYQFVSSW